MIYEEFTEKFWKVRPWVQNGTYPDWPYAVYQFIVGRRLKRIIEVGPGTGAVTWAIAVAGPDDLVCIDNEMEGHPLHSVGELLKGVGFQRVKLCQGKSEDWLPRLEGEYDLLVHDGEHSFKSVVDDCEQARRLGCRYVIVHDSNWPEVDGAIKSLGWPEWLLLEHSAFPRVLCNPSYFTAPQA